MAKKGFLIPYFRLSISLCWSPACTPGALKLTLVAVAWSVGGGVGDCLMVMSDTCQTKGTCPGLLGSILSFKRKALKAFHRGMRAGGFPGAFRVMEARYDST